MFDFRLNAMGVALANAEKAKLVGLLLRRLKATVFMVVR